MRTLIMALLALVYLCPGVQGQCGIFVNELDITLDRGRDVFIVKGLACDRCRYGASGSQICQCRRACKLTPIEKGMVENCYQDCQKYYGDNEEAYDYCIEDCSELESELLEACRDNCGPRPLPVRAIHSISFVGQVWFTKGLFETMMGIPERTVFAEFPEGNPPNTLTIEVEDVPAYGISYCYVTGLRITYTDGSCCIYIDWNCFNLG